MQKHMRYRSIKPQHAASLTQRLIILIRFRQPLFLLLIPPRFPLIPLTIDFPRVILVLRVRCSGRFTSLLLAERCDFVIFVFVFVLVLPLCASAAPFGRRCWTGRGDGFDFGIIVCGSLVSFGSVYLEAL